MLSSRPLRSMLIGLLVLLGASAGVDAAVTTEAPSASPIADRRSEASDEQLFVDKINELRTGLGLEPLAVDPMLVPLARDWAAHLRSQGALSHAGDLSVGVTGDWTRLGENVGVGPTGQIQALFDAFVASPAHYANLVKADYRYIGVGVVYGDDGRIWTAHRFMAVAEGTSATPEPRGPVVATSTSTTIPTTSTSVAATPTTQPSAAPGAAATPETQVTTAPATGPEATTTTSIPADAVDRPVVSPVLSERLASELAAAGL